MASERFSFKKARISLGAALAAPTIMLAPVNNTDFGPGEVPVRVATYANDIPTNPDVLFSGYQWKRKDPADTSPLIITYRFQELDSRKSRDKSDVDTIPYTAEQRQAFRQATREFERFANIKFVEFHEGIQTNAADIDSSKPMIEVTTKSKLHGINDKGKTLEFLGYAPFPYYNNSSAANTTNYILSSLRKVEENKSVGSYVIHHEIGHNLGLKHPVDKLSAKTFRITPEQDAVEISIMSNKSVGGQSQFAKGKQLVKREDGSLPSGLMPLDAAALQKMYGANTSSFMGADTHYFTNSNETRTLWNGGKPYTLDARGFNSTAETDITLDANPGRVSVVGGEVMFNPLNAEVKVLRGSKSGTVNFKGNVKGGTRFEGGDGYNLFEVLGKGNHAISPAGAQASYVAAYPGAELVMEGFDAKKGAIMFLYPHESNVTAWRDGNDMTLEMRMGRFDSARITLKNFKGKAEDINVIQSYTANAASADMDTFKPKQVTESTMPAWLHKVLRKDDPRTR